MNFNKELKDRIYSIVKKVWTSLNLGLINQTLEK